MAMIFGAYIICALIGYIFGAFPTGFFVGKLWNVDVRKHGSGRTGGTNVLRSAGWVAFTITVVGDVLKGVLAVLLARWLFPDLHSGQALTALAVLIGANWSVWIALLAKPDPRETYAPPPLGWIQRVAQQGRGGAGVVASAGAALALFPPIVLFLAPFLVLILVIVRYASVASLTTAVVGPIVMFYFALTGSAPWSYAAVVLLMGIIIIIVHIPNIQRLRAGTEKRFGQRLGQKPNR